jgi:hypothetical protein
MTMQNNPGELSPAHLPRLSRRQQRARRKSDTLAGGLSSYETYIPLTALERTRRIGKAAIIPMLVMITPFNILTVDGMMKDYELAHSEPSLIEIATNSDPAFAHSAIIVSLGFGSVSAESTARQFAPELDKFGHVLAMVYDKKGIDYDRSLEVIDDMLQKYDITSLSFMGTSIGGVMNDVLAEKILTGDYGVSEIPLMIKNESPSGTDGLQIEYVQQGSFQTWAHKEFPQQTKGTIARFLAEMYIRRDRFSGQGGQFNRGMSVPQAVLKTSGDVIRDTINNPLSASNELLNSAYTHFENIDETKIITSIGEYEAKHAMVKTTWVYIGNPNDYVIKTQESVDAITTPIIESGMPAPIVMMDKHLVHGEPYLAKKAYNQIFKKLVPQILKSIKQQQTIASDIAANAQIGKGGRFTIK